MSDNSILPDMGKVSNPWPELEEAAEMPKPKKKKKVKAGSYSKTARKGYEDMLREAGE